MASLAIEKPWLFASASKHFVFVVVSIIAPSQVFWIYAPRIIARVKYTFLPRRRMANVHYRRDSVGVDLFPKEADIAISIRLIRAFPFPAPRLHLSVPAIINRVPLGHARLLS